MTARLTYIQPKDPDVAGKRPVLKEDGSVAGETVGWHLTATAVMVDLPDAEELAAVLMLAAERGAHLIHAVPSAPVVGGQAFPLVNKGAGGNRRARTGEHFVRHAGPGFLAIDTNAPFDPTPEGVMRAIVDACPLAGGAKPIWWPSSSSMIALHGELIKPLKGSRTYIGILDATDTDRAGDVLFHLEELREKATDLSEALCAWHQ